MFLNWVYRRLTDVPPTWAKCSGPYDGTGGNWQGFRNIDANGNPDSQQSGNERYRWVDIQIQAIFQAHSQWQ